MSTVICHVWYIVVIIAHFIPFLFLWIANSLSHCLVVGKPIGIEVVNQVRHVYGYVSLTGLVNLSEFCHITPTRNPGITDIVMTLYSCELHAHLTACNVSLITTAC